MKYFSKGFLCFLFCCCFLLASSQRTDPTEVDTLRIIWNHLVDINGNLSNWNRGDPCSSKWTGVMCSTVDGYLHVQRLHLMNMSLAGSLVPEIGNLSHLEILDFMWNNISGPIPKEIGNIKTLRLLLLNGNQLTGHLPEELGYLPVLKRIQIDQNNITGPIPLSFANLTNAKHFHMNNNSLSGQIPSQLSGLRNLLHLLLDNNNLSGHLPDELAEMPSLNILQLDNNNFGGNSIPDSYSNMSKLLKLSLRNCNLTGPIPDLSRIPHLGYLDLSFNQLSESIPSNKLSENITTIDLSNNRLNGTIPSSFSDLPRLQKLSISNNELSGDVPSSIWQNKTLNGTKKLFLDMKNNRLTSISGSISNLPSNITIQLEGNPICSNNNNTVVQFCGTETENDMNGNSIIICPTQPCPPPYEYSLECVCVVPLLVNYRLKSPGFSDFNAYVEDFESFLTSVLNIDSNQLFINSFVWEDGRLRMYLKLFPVSVDNTTRHTFNQSEVIRLRDMFREWDIHESDLFGPYELLDFVLLDPYKDITVSSSSSGISKGALVGIVLGAIACSVTLSVIVAILIFRIRLNDYRTLSTRRKSKTSKSSIKIDGVRTFNYEEMALATNNFSQSAQVGQGGYGKVYKGNLPDGTVVAIKRAQEGSLQGEKEFLTEIQLLSRLHHRNLVSLIGYCDEDGEQMLVYEYMPNGTLRDHLSAHSKEPLSFPMRLKIALGSAKGLVYLHTEADPPIFHRDVKASNILLDSKFIAKVADFGLSRLAPVPDIEGNLPNHISTVVKGTPGYLDPEYFLTRKLTDKSDVYSLGVVFLEIVTGKPPIFHGENIIRQVKLAFGSGGVFSIIDNRMGFYTSEIVEKFLALGLKCCKDEPDERPKMTEVARELENILAMMPEYHAKKGSEYDTSDSGTTFSSQPSSSTIKNPFISEDILGSDLVSGDVPTIRPR
ncbi:probable LRR receptor-like serine/threonine-protein kinase At1g06840 [Trifolium pratense]|uniref:probable LRR receptor-like serine/threonine-protein kinase At1g06840 n=1 Tax=Trifolium pratense TaxID=57577 RepID=UPI001E697428|nr:probable LRR receptor-like serine/threonine-protein kinase At1g06840 [Trifolium pratense]XP_045833703.1 probable LRR receptor-like serine/threonine-protein kinase At1g06840 [Trifolium pratense]